MLRRLHPDQPESFAFTSANMAWAEAQLKKYPEGRQASAIIPLLWRAQEQEGWLSRPAIEHVADMLGLAHIRALEVATFYFMFQLKPVGSLAHVQVCGTLSCMLCGSEDLIGVCQEKIAAAPHALSADGKFSWEEVECLGACANAPMVQIGKDYYEDLTVETFGWILDELAAGRTPAPGSYKGRFSSEPEGGATTLLGDEHHKTNGSLGIALQMGDSIKRIDGTEPAFSFAVEPDAPIRPVIEPTPIPAPEPDTVAAPAPAPQPQAKPEAPAAQPQAEPEAPVAEEAPELYTEAPAEVDDLQRMKGVGPKLETTLNELGVYRFAQIASWGPAEIAWVNARLSFKGRIERDNWIGQAKQLMSGD